LRIVILVTTASRSCAKLSWDSSSLVAGLISPLPFPNLIYKLLGIVQQEIRSYWENHHNLQEKVPALNDRVVSSEIWKCFRAPRDGPPSRWALLKPNPLARLPGASCSLPQCGWLGNQPAEDAAE